MKTHEMRDGTLGGEWRIGQEDPLEFYLRIMQQM